MSSFTDALARFAARGLVAADLSSSEWRDVPLALRERAFFSARIAHARRLQEIKDRVESLLNPQTVRRADRVTPQNPDGFVTEGLDPATARAEIKQIRQSIGYNPGDKAGTIQDLSSDARINLQLKTNVESAQGYAGFLQGQSEGALEAFPAQELFRAEDRGEPRNWPTRWMQSGGQIFGGRMIALKSDPVWQTIGDSTLFPDALGNPYPPFAFNSGMWVRDVSREDAIALGLMAATDPVRTVLQDYNARLEASAQNLEPEVLQSLQTTFGDRIRITGDRIEWNPRGTIPPPRN